MAYTHLSGRYIRFDVLGVNDVTFMQEYEIISGGVNDVCTLVNHYRPMGRKICNTIPDGRVVTFTFLGALLVDNVPWGKLTPEDELIWLRVTLNREGITVNDTYYSETSHECETAVVISCEHTFDTSTHQVFNLTIMADGSYTPPRSANVVVPDSE